MQVLLRQVQDLPWHPPHSVNAPPFVAEQFLLNQDPIPVGRAAQDVLQDLAGQVLNKPLLALMLAIVVAVVITYCWYPARCSAEHDGLS